jgi:hypothetical protein
VPRKSTGLACLRTAFAGVVLLSASAAGAQEASERPSGDILLTDQLERIAEQRDITFKGLDKTFGVPAPRNGEVDWDRLGLPLSEFNHTVVHTPDGTVKQVIIMGPKRRAAALTAPIPRRRPVLAETPAAAPVNGARRRRAGAAGGHERAGTAPTATTFGSTTATAIRPLTAICSGLPPTPAKLPGSVPDR